MSQGSPVVTRGTYIVIEGIVGKTTQASLLRSYTETTGIPCVFLEEFETPPTPEQYAEQVESHLTVGSNVVLTTNYLNHGLPTPDVVIYLQNTVDGIARIKMFGRDEAMDGKDLDTNTEAYDVFYTRALQTKTRLDALDRSSRDCEGCVGKVIRIDGSQPRIKVHQQIVTELGW